MKTNIIEAFAKHKEALLFLEKHIADIEDIAHRCITVIKGKGKIMVAGNGGSASDAQHFVAELVGRFKKNRMPLPAIALTTNTAIITAIGNDFGYDEVFWYQVQALGQKQDLLIVLSSSGNSSNIVKAVEQARKQGIETIALLGKDGGKVRTMVDKALTIPFDTPRSQEMHGFVIHVLSELIEETLFPSS